MDRKPRPTRKQKRTLRSWLHPRRENTIFEHLDRREHRESRLQASRAARPDDLIDLRGQPRLPTAARPGRNIPSFVIIGAATLGESKGVEAVLRLFPTAPMWWTPTHRDPDVPPYSLVTPRSSKNIVLWDHSRLDVLYITRPPKPRQVEGFSRRREKLLLQQTPGFVPPASLAPVVSSEPRVPPARSRSVSWTWAAPLQPGMAYDKWKDDWVRCGELRMYFRAFRTAGGSLWYVAPDGSLLSRDEAIWEWAERHCPNCNGWMTLDALLSADEGGDG